MAITIYIFFFVANAFMTFSFNNHISLYHTSSVAEAVREILETDWLLFRMLQSGVANFTALAAKIRPNVENRIGTPVSLNTIVASLNRIARILDVQRDPNEDDKLPFGARLSLSDQVFEIVTEIDDLSELAGLYNKLSQSSYTPFGIFLSLNTCRFYIDNNSNQNNHKQEFPSGFKTEQGFTKIKIDFPRLPELVPSNLIYEISSLLHSSNMDVHSAFFTPSGIVLVIENDKAAKLYGLLQEKLNRKNNSKSD